MFALVWLDLRALCNTLSDIIHYHTPKLGEQLRKQAVLRSRRASKTSGQEQAAEKGQAREGLGYKEEKQHVSAPVKPVVIYPLL